MNGPRYWILGPDGRTPIGTDDILEWGKALEDKETPGSGARVGWDFCNDRGITVSTVFLGLDHGFGDGPPLLFETMIFGGDHDQYQERYATWEEAERGHAMACDLAGLNRLLEGPGDDH